VALDASGNAELQVERNAVTPGFFDAIGVEIRAGRTFDEREQAASGVAVINETLAQRLFGSTQTVGRQLWIDRVPHRVVGIVADYATTYAESRGISPKFFVPLDPQPKGARLLYVLARADGNPTLRAERLQRAARAAAGDNPVIESFTYLEMGDVINREWLVALAPLPPLITMGVALTAAGIYGVLAFAIARRTRELAIRVALGASARDQMALVSLRSLRLVAVGTSIGTGLTFALSRVVRAAGGGGSMYDPPWEAFVVPMQWLTCTHESPTNCGDAEQGGPTGRFRKNVSARNELAVGSRGPAKPPTRELASRTSTPST
jgi:hypothetical protein